MDTRKIYYVYKNVVREVDELKQRISYNEFLNLLLRPSKDDLFFTSLFKENRISDFIDEWSINGFTGVYMKNPYVNDKYVVKGDVMMIKEVKCPDDMSKDTFLNLSINDLEKIIIDNPLYEVRTDYVCNNIPVNIDILEEVEFKPTFDKLRMIVKNKTDNNTFFDFEDYLKQIKSYIRDFCEDKSFSELSDNYDINIEKFANYFSDHLQDDFNFNNMPFIINNEIKNRYKQSIKTDLEDVYARCLYEKDLEKGGRRR